MKWLIGGVIVLLIAMGVVFYMKALASRQGQAAGMVAGQLIPCANKPNCVCSEYKQDTEHYIEPLALTGSTDEALIQLKQVLQTLGGVVTQEQQGYLAATFTSKGWGFVDDVELRFDEVNHVVHIRSASRQGYSDFKVNRKRMEKLRQQLMQAQPTP